MKDFQFITSSHPSYIENLYHDFSRNPDSVDPDMRKFFEGFDFAVSSGFEKQPAVPSVNGVAGDKLQKELKAAEEKLLETDKKLLAFFFTTAASKSEEAKLEFTNAFNAFRACKEDSAYTQKFVNDSFELL
ncbi:MAG: hypothetical protein EOP53_21080 [Sphingobacteriales bacterium]|nr:MAG: hypothetical protein EOP53_21080 [Sphingobacteriales bacterium]